jgi:uncharacterized protein (DUF983 family)
MNGDASPKSRIPATHGAPDKGEDKRHVGLSILRGLAMRCPRCGRGGAFDGYLSIRCHCPVCGEKLGHIRADDGPAYFTVLLVGHIVVPLSLLAEQLWHPPLAAHVVAAVALTGVLIWRLLPRIKGGVLGGMWALGLKGDELQGDLDRHG